MTDHSTHAEHHHPPARLYAAVLGALLVLTVITVYAASFNFGNMNIVIALFIATVKGSLVALFFMHLRYDKPLNALIFLAGIFFLALFLGFCLIDTNTRPNIIPANLKVPVPAPAAAAPGTASAAPGTPPAAPAPAAPAAEPH